MLGVLGSGVAFGVLAMTSLFAAVVFPLMRDLDPSLPAYAAYDGPHWSLAAGILAERLFEIGFIVVGGALAVCFGALLALWVGRRSGRAPIARLALWTVTASVFTAQIAVLQPRMNDAASDYREAAAAGANETVTEARERFSALHPSASRLMGGATIAALALFATTAAATGRPDGNAGGSSR